MKAEHVPNCAAEGYTRRDGLLAVSVDNMPTGLIPCEMKRAGLQSDPAMQMSPATSTHSMIRYLLSQRIH